MSKSKKKKPKITADFSQIPAETGARELEHPFERNEKRGPGRPIGKRSNPAFRQYTVLIRRDTHDKAMRILRKTTARPDFGEYVETLILEDYKRQTAAGG